MIAMGSMQTRVSRALMRLRMIERAMHDATGWALRCEGSEVPATVEVTDESVRFTALLPGLCSIGDDHSLVHIVKDGEPVWTTRLDGPLGENGTQVTYEASLPSISSVE